MGEPCRDQGMTKVLDAVIFEYWTTLSRQDFLNDFRRLHVMKRVTMRHLNFDVVSKMFKVPCLLQREVFGGTKLRLQVQCLLTLDAPLRSARIWQYRIGGS